MYKSQSIDTDAVTKLRASLSDEDASDPWLTDETLMRYIVARRGKIDAAKKMLQSTLAWRKKTFTFAGPVCELCCKEWTTHCFLPIGLSQEGCPVLFGSVPRNNFEFDNDPDLAVKHFAHTLEKVFSVPSSAAQFIWIFDFAGYGLSHAMMIKASLGYASVFSNHFPERLFRVVLLNPPAVFGMCLSMVTPFLDERTHAKIVTLHTSPEQVREKLGAKLRLKEHTLQWLEAALKTAPKPGTLPPLPPDSAELQLSPSVPIAHE